jgi:hypothetical protein
MQALKNKYVNDATRKTGFTTYLPEGITPDQAAGLIN